MLRKRNFSIFPSDTCNIFIHFRVAQRQLAVTGRHRQREHQEVVVASCLYYVPCMHAAYAQMFVCLSGWDVACFLEHSLFMGFAHMCVCASVVADCARRVQCMPCPYACEFCHTHEYLLFLSFLRVRRLACFTISLYMSLCVGHSTAA